MVQAVVEQPLSVRQGQVSTAPRDYLASAVAVLKSSATLTAVGLAGLSFVLVSSLVYFREQMAQLGSWGYVGVFFAELINSAVILLPTPSPAYTLAASVMLNPLLVGVVGGVASGMGELVGYTVGTRGRRAMGTGKLVERFKAMAMRWGDKALFAFALLPLPFDVAGLWAGAVHYPVWRFLLYVTAGKVLKVTAIAFLGYYGVSWLLRPLA